MAQQAYTQAPDRVQEAAALKQQGNVLDGQLAGYTSEELAAVDRILALERA